MDKNYFSELNDIDVSKYVEKKNNLSYLSWSYAWGEIKKRYPDVTSKIYERVVDDYGNTLNYFTDGKTCYVKVGVTINGLEHIVELPVMDNRNNSILLDNVTSMDVNKAIQRCLTKAIAMHGLGLYIYSGEDLPEAIAEAKNAEVEKQREALKGAIKEIVDLGKKLISSGQLSKQEVVEVVAAQNNGVGNPSNITSLEVCAKVKEALNDVAKKK